MSVDKLRRGIVTRLAQLVESTRMLDLNRSDSDFRKQSGEVFCVLDTNVLQAYLDPARHFHFSRLFHNPDWQAEDEEEKASDDLHETMGAQATLLAAEFIMAPQMRATPGGATDRMFMSLPHYRELEGQIVYLNREIQDFMDDNPDYDVGQVYRRIGETLDLRGKGRSEVQAVMLADKQFVAPPQLELDRFDGARFERLRDDYVLSAICRALAEDRVLEPLEQLERLARDDMWERMSPIEWQFPVETDKERATIASYEAIWMTRLHEELDLRRRHGREEREERGPESLMNDARTMAHLIWATRYRAKPNQRIILVTGDRLLLSAYKRWYSKSGDALSFMLRPFAQFGPQYNLKDTQSPVAGNSPFFERTREALESSTIPLIFTLLPHYPELSGRPVWYAGSQARDRFCADAVYHIVEDDIVDDLIKGLAYNRAALKTKADELDAIAAALRSIERLAVGSMPRLIEIRAREAISRSEEFLALTSASSGEEARRITTSWFEERQQRALDRAFVFAVPYAASHILNAKNIPGSVPRFPVVLLLPLKGRYVSAARWVAGTTVEERLAALQSWDAGPAILLALASWITFLQGLWSEATRFADLADQAARHSQAPVPEGAAVAPGTIAGPPPIDHECRYLNALSLRMRMASRRPGPEVDVDLWLRDLQGAEKALQGDVENSDRIVRCLRARGERAAARLTYCAWAATGDLCTLPPYHHGRLELQDIIVGAVDDLVWVASQLSGARARVEAEAGPDQEMRIAVLDWVALQASANRECARLVYDRLLQMLHPVRKEILVARNLNVERGLKSLGRTRIALEEVAKHKIIGAYHLSAEGRAIRGDGKLRNKPERKALLLDLQQQVEAISLDANALDLDKAMLGVIKERARAGFAPPSRPIG